MKISGNDQENVLINMTNQITDHFKTQETCIEAVHREPSSLFYVPGYFKTQYMCIETVSRETYVLGCVPDCFKT